MRALLLTAALASAACAPTVDVDKADVEGYADWYQVEATGKIPGHGDTVRVIYANDAALEYGGAGYYPNGAVLVKEIYHRQKDDTRGALDYISIMRKMEAAPPGGELDQGWLFTLVDGDIGGEELYYDSCWSTCHAAAPYDGVFLQYGLE